MLQTLRNSSLRARAQPQSVIRFLCISRFIASSRSSGSGSSSDSSNGSSPARLPAAAAAAAPFLTPAGMVQTRAGAAAEWTEQCRLERVISNLQASCSASPSAPPVRARFAAPSCPPRPPTTVAHPCRCTGTHHKFFTMMLSDIPPSPICGQQVSGKFAAVLVALFEDPESGEVHVVLNQRSSKLSTHGGVCPRCALRLRGQLLCGSAWCGGVASSQPLAVESPTRLPTCALLAGEVCFPGGKRDPADADDIGTALREAQVGFKVTHY